MAKWVLTLPSDKDALMLLLMIGGGVLALLVLLPLYFQVRGSLRPKTSGRIGSMGIN